MAKKVNTYVVAAYTSLTDDETFDLRDSSNLICACFPFLYTNIDTDVDTADGHGLVNEMHCQLQYVTNNWWE